MTAEERARDLLLSLEWVNDPEETAINVIRAAEDVAWNEAIQLCAQYLRDWFSDPDKPIPTTEYGLMKLLDHVKALKKD